MLMLEESPGRIRGWPGFGGNGGGADARVGPVERHKPGLDEQ